MSVRLAGLSGVLRRRFYIGGACLGLALFLAACAPSTYNPGDPSSDEYYSLQVLRCIFDRSVCPPPFSPQDVSGLQLWLKADALNLSDGSTVSTWPDSSGLGRDASGGSSPTLTAGGLNGLPVVTFNGTHFMEITGLTQDPAVTAHTLIAVFRTTGVANEILLTNVDTPGTGRVQLGHYIGCPNQMATVLNAGIRCSMSTYTDDAWDLFTLQWDLTNLYFYSMGAFLSSIGEGATGGGGSWRIGATKAGSENLNGQVAEVLIYNRSLAESERKSIECYLAGRYGLSTAVTNSCSK